MKCGPVTHFPSGAVPEIEWRMRAIPPSCWPGWGCISRPIWVFAEELRDARVVAVMQDWTPTLLPIQAVFPTRRQVPPRVRAVIDHLAAEFRLDPSLSDHAGA
jgi:hypothetical protein